MKVDRTEKKSRLRRRLLAGAVSLALVIVAGVALRNEGPGSRFELEGMYRDLNYRDVGLSLNQCLTEVERPPVFQEGKLLRANRLFSGWGCDQVGQPEQVVTWNYRPDRKWTFFCQQDDGRKVAGFVPTTAFEISDIEFMATWKDGDHREAICRGFKTAIMAVAAAERTLIHCDAGRDRTGATAAILAAVSYEQAGYQIDDDFLAALECDYRKSASLKPYKYGRMASWHRAMISEYGGASAFLMNQCGFNQTLLQAFAAEMIAGQAE